MLEVYRVRQQFGWNGWQFAPGPICRCPCSDIKGSSCTGQTGTGCGECRMTTCHCSCGLAKETYGGDLWFVEERHPRKEIMLTSRKAVADPSLPPIDELIKEPKLKRLLEPPKEPATAGRRR